MPAPSDLIRYPVYGAYPVDYYQNFWLDYERGPAYQGRWIAGQAPGPYALSGEMRFPTHGLPPRTKEDRPALSPWGRLCAGGAIGKKTIIPYDASDNARQPSPVTILNVTGDDMDATHVTVTLLPPQVIALAFSQTLARMSAQNQTGEQDNLQISANNFPGGSSPIQWPPIEAILEWGVGGSSVRAAVDFANGTTVNLTGVSFVRVHATVLRNAGIVGTSALYVLSAMVGPGMARPGSARKTVYVGSVDSLAESGVFPVPHFATRAYVIGQDDGVSPNIAVSVATLRFWQSPNGTNNVGNFVVTGNQPLPFPIPNGAAYFSVANGMSVASRMSVAFELAI